MRHTSVKEILSVKKILSVKEICGMGWTMTGFFDKVKDTCRLHFGHYLAAESMAAWD